MLFTKKYDNSLFLNMISDKRLLLNIYIHKMLKNELNDMMDDECITLVNGLNIN